jgi:hypothetical protein
MPRRNRVKTNRRNTRGNATRGNATRGNATRGNATRGKNKNCMNTWPSKNRRNTRKRRGGTCEDSNQRAYDYTMQFLYK